VLRAWQGLGYNRRALALQKLAKEVIAPRFKGKLPRDLESLISLPGIGPYTAGAIRAFAFNEPEIFIETNIRRVFIQFFFPRRKQVTDAELRRYIERTIDSKNPREWYYALMDYGAMLGEVARHTKNAKKETNPNRRSAHYVRQSAFAGSDREVRGYVLRELLKRKKVAIREITEHFDRSAEKISGIISGLAKEGFIIKKGNFIELTH
jgi:A/G-specific adenine glycosylase